tara:strand:+ start:186 stop:530 length:345 start_codon:yes stop_codon:yes gene_type:complete
MSDQQGKYQLEKIDLEDELAALREQLTDCSAVVDRQQEQLDRNAAPSDTRNYYADGYEAGYQVGMEEKKPWIGLTDEDKNNCLVSADPCESLSDPEAQQLMKDVEAKLKEKNGG